jgi:hypothetical protein
MELDVGGWRTVQDPNEAQIREAIRELDEYQGFLILSAADLTYIQSSGDSSIGFDLEYQEGSIDHHYRARKYDFDAEMIVARFSAYAAGDNGWRVGIDWEKTTL